LANTWIKIDKVWRADRSALRSIRGNFGLPISEILRNSMTGHLIVRTESNFTPKKIGAVEI
jgi:hypothetical protein